MEEVISVSLKVFNIGCKALHDLLPSNTQVNENICGIQWLLSSPLQLLTFAFHNLSSCNKIRPFLSPSTSNGLILWKKTLKRHRQQETNNGGMTLILGGSKGNFRFRKWLRNYIMQCLCLWTIWPIGSSVIF